MSAGDDLSRVDIKADYLIDSTLVWQDEPMDASRGLNDHVQVDVRLMSYDSGGGRMRGSRERSPFPLVSKPNNKAHDTYSMPRTDPKAST